MAVDANGSYTKLTPETIKRLEEVFSLDGSIEEACFWAEISKQTYYNWLKKNPKMGERFDALRERPTLKARKEVVSGIDNNPEFALKYLERKKKKEFSTQQNFDHTTDGKPITINTIQYGSGPNSNNTLPV